MSRRLEKVYMIQYKFLIYPDQQLFCETDLLQVSILYNIHTSSTKNLS